MTIAVRGIMAAALAALLIALGDHAKSTAPLPLLALALCVAGMFAAIATGASLLLIRDWRRERRAMSGPAPVRRKPEELDQ